MIGLNSRLSEEILEQHRQIVSSLINKSNNADSFIRFLLWIALDILDLLIDLGGRLFVNFIFYAYIVFISSVICRMIANMRILPWDHMYMVTCCKESVESLKGLGNKRSTHLAVFIMFVGMELSY